MRERRRKRGLIKWIQRLVAIPELIVNFTILRRDAETCLQDPLVKAAWDRFSKDTAVEGTIARLSAEWRAVEDVVNRIV